MKLHAVSCFGFDLRILDALPVHGDSWPDGFYQAGICTHWATGDISLELRVAIPYAVLQTFLQSEIESVSYLVALSIVAKVQLVYIGCLLCAVAIHYSWTDRSFTTSFSFISSPSAEQDLGLGLLVMILNSSA